jgi:4-hydroxybenzoate polyprenyltransferase
MLCYAIALGLFAGVGVAAGRGAAFHAGVAAAAAIAGYHYVLIRERDRARCFAAFRHNNWVGAVVFAGIAIDYVLFPLR